MKRIVPSGLLTAFIVFSAASPALALVCPQGLTYINPHIFDSPKSEAASGLKNHPPEGKPCCKVIHNWGGGKTVEQCAPAIDPTKAPCPPGSPGGCIGKHKMGGNMGGGMDSSQDTAPANSQ